MATYQYREPDLAILARKDADATLEIITGNMNTHRRGSNSGTSMLMHWLSNTSAGTARSSRYHLLSLSVHF